MFLLILNKYIWFLISYIYRETIRKQKGKKTIYTVPFLTFDAISNTPKGLFIKKNQQRLTKDNMEGFISNSIYYLMTFIDII